ncbi:MAG: hypothetical protein JJU45_03205 [Acidimicrobiia bacterium]|nr:hypothetical protein [Acidimicrobiia bacterium]
MRPNRFLVLTASALLATGTLAACGDDDGGGATDAADNGSEAADQGDGQPSDLLADALDDVEMPDAGVAVITVDGTTYEFDDLDNCGLTEGMETTGFSVNAMGETDDGASTRLEVTRSVHDSGDIGVGGIYERDWVQLSVFMERDDAQDGFSNTIMDTTRDELGGPVTGDGDTLPVVKVLEEDGVVMATAVGEVALMPFTRDYDAAGEGAFEFAVNCG